MPLLEISDLSLEFAGPSRATPVLDRVSLTVDAGETVCLVGESGSGKSVTALSAGLLLPSPPARYTGGCVVLEGRNLLELPKRELRRVRGSVVSYVFQDPGNSLNPVFRVGAQIREMLRLHRREADSDEEAARLLERVGIPAPRERLRAYPHEMSGGMQQRVMIAMAIASRPKLLIADEPTSALDVTIQAQIIELLRELKEQLGMAMLLITHNLGIVGGIAERMAVMYAGQIVESGPAKEVLQRPLHPYTRSLIASVPALGRDQERLPAIPGSPPQPGAWPGGCRFHPRCPSARPECSRNAPELLQPVAGRFVRCPFHFAP